MDLTGWVHARDIHVQTACRSYREGTLPVLVHNSGRLVLVSREIATEAARKTEGAGLYTQVSSDKQKSSLDGQVAGRSTWTAEAGLPVAQVEAGVESGVNGLRAKVRGPLSDPAVTMVVAGHQDRPGQVNTELAAAALSVQHRHLVVPGNSGVTGDPAELQRSGGGV